MAKRTLTPEYRAGAEAFAALNTSWRANCGDDLQFFKIGDDMMVANLGQTPEFQRGFAQAVAVFIESIVNGSVPQSGWSPMRDLEDPDWWREDEPEGSTDA